MVLLHARHAALDAGPAAELVHSEGRSGLELAARHATHEALAGSGRDAGGRGRGRSLRHEALLAHLPPGPAELVAGELGDRLPLTADDARDNTARNGRSSALCVSELIQKKDGT